MQDKPELLTHGCAQCDARWFGLDRAHCSGCHETFDDAGLYDAHRLNAACAPPASLGLVRNKGGIWLRLLETLRAVS